MSYIEDNLLNAKESMIYMVHRSWIHYIRSLFIAYIVIFVPGIALLLQPVYEFTPEIEFLIVALLIIIALGVTIYYLMIHAAEEYVITNERVITKEGIISHVIYEISIENIESIDIRQGILGRIFGFGTIEINGTGDEDRRIVDINKPVEFRKEIQA